jgi:hypothetical protein
MVSIMFESHEFENDETDLFRGASAGRRLNRNRSTGAAGRIQGLFEAESSRKVASPNFLSHCVFE